MARPWHHWPGTAKVGSLGSTTLYVALPALVLELDVLDGDGVGVGVEIGQRLVFRDPAAIDLVGDRQLAGLVVDLDDESLRKSFSETSLPSPAPKFQTLLAHCSNSVSWVTPRSSVIASILGAAGRLAAAARIAALAVLDHLGRALQPADLADAGDVAAVPLDPELEVLVRIEALRVDGELGHDDPLCSGLRSAPAICWIWMHDELGRLQRREADDDVDDAEVDVVLRGRLVVALDEVGRRAGVVPWNAPWRNRLCMKAPTLSRICAQSGSSFGSNTTHCVPRYRLSSM